MDGECDAHAWQRFKQRMHVARLARGGDSNGAEGHRQAQWVGQHTNRRDDCVGVVERLAHA
eukprot:6143481-Pleurochrysis_carterae.AAC.2